MPHPDTSISPLSIYAERVGWGLYLPLLAAALLAHLDRTGVPFLPLWLTFSTLLSLVILVILVILFALVADRGYTDTVRNSGSGFLTLGGGLLLTVLLLLPLLHLAEVLKRAALPTTEIPVLPFLIVCLAGFALALKHVWHPAFRGTRPGLRLTLACFPYIFILSLWLVWLGRTLWLYIRLGEDTFWLKLLCAFCAGGYAVLIAYAVLRLSALFRLTPPRQ